METESRREIGRLAGKLGAGHLLGRVLGLVRDMVFAFIFGAGSAADSWVVAFRIPGLLRYFIAEGAVNAGLIPIASEYEARGDRQGLWSFAGRVFGTVLIAMLVVVILLIIATPYLLPLCAPGFAQDPAKLHLTVRLSQLSFLYVVLITFASMSMSLLYLLRRFTGPALNTALFNVTMILALVFLCPLIGGPPQRMVYGAVVGLVAAGIAQAALQWAALRRVGGRFRLRLNLKDENVRRSFRLMAPLVIGFSLYEMHVLVDVFLASRLPTGSIASLEYAVRLVQVPLGIFAVALSTTLLPVYSRMKADGHTQKLLDAITYALRSMLYVLLPSTVLILLLRRDIVRVIFERGAFAGSSATATTAWALGCFSGFLVAHALIQSARPAFYALQDTKTPVRTAAAGFVVKICASILLVRSLGVGGLALGTVASATTDGVLLHLILAKRFGFHIDLKTTMSIGKTVLSTGVLVAIVILISGGITGTSPAASLVRLLLASVAGSTGYFVVSRFLRSEERWFVLDLLHIPRRRTAGPDGSSPYREKE